MDDNKNNGLMTKIWGAHLWEGLHAIAFGYPIEPTEEQKSHYKNFFMNWHTHCHVNFQENHI